jgi:hypothetical protein
MEDRVVLLFVSTRKRDNEETRGMWESAFRRSRWFTRGWTLQELLAPVSVQFFSREGERLGDKRTLEQIIHEITTIPWDTLRGYPLHQFQAPPGTPRHQSDNSSTMVYCMTETNLCPSRSEMWECSTNKGTAAVPPRCSSAVCTSGVRCTSAVAQGSWHS